MITRKFVRAAGIAVCAVLVAGTLVTASAALLRFQASSGSGAAGGGLEAVGALSVTGDPPRPASSFAGGAEVAWHVNNADGGDVTAVADSKVWMIVATGASGGTKLLGADRVTGAHLWSNDQSLSLTCAPTALNGSAYCYAPGGSDGPEASSVFRISLSDGRVLGSIQLARTGGEVGLDRIAVLGGAVVVEQWVSTGAASQAFAAVHRVAADLAEESWHAVIPNPRQSNASETWPTIGREQNDVLVLCDGFADLVLNFSTGAVIHSSTYGDEDVLADGTIVAARAGDPTGTEPHGYVRAAPESLVPVDFSSSAEAPPLPLFFTAAGDGTVTVNAYAADGSTPRWKAPVVFAGSRQWSAVYGAFQNGVLVLTDTAGHVTAVDPATGSALWANSYNAPERTDGGADFTEPSLYFADDGTFVVADPTWGNDARLHAFSASTGTALWTLDGVRLVGVSGPGRVFVQDGAGFGPLIAVGGTSIPAPSAAGLPDCPNGMTPISWSTYPGGHLLLCGGDGHYRADVTLGEKTMGCSALEFSAGGYVLTCGGGTIVRAAAAGAVIQFSVGGTTWTQPAARAWSAASPPGPTSTGFGTAPARMPVSCPVDAVPLAISTWQGGWLLICGTDALHATSFAYRTETGQVTGATMTFDNGVYCGSDARGNSVCASATPAVVIITPQNGSPTQLNATADYFASSGTGGAGKGTGAYGVAAPKATADDEVRYLVQILQKSQQGRAAVGGLVVDLLRCSVSSTEVTTAQSVVSNRQELIDALATTPVDRVPSGARLIAELKQALTVSLQADSQYQAAAQQMASGDCENGMVTAKAAVDVANTTDALKKTFADDWNATVAGSYTDAPAIDPGKL